MRFPIFPGRHLPLAVAREVSRGAPPNRSPVWWSPGLLLGLSSGLLSGLLLSLLLTLLASRHALAAEAPTAPPPAIEAAAAMNTVNVAGGKVDERRDDTAAMIVVKHDEIVRHGDDTLADVLKRLPGISIAGAPGQGGEIRMRGLGNGYTQIMLNGTPAPAGFSLDTLAPELIERIEIMRAANALYSTQAIAGAINIVLRKTVAPERQEAKLGMGDSHGRRSPNLALQLSGRRATFSYTLAATAARKASQTPSTALEDGRAGDGQPVLSRSTLQQESLRRDSADLAPRLNWAWGEHDTLTWQSYAGVSRIDNRRAAQETTPLGAATDFPLSRSRYVASGSVLRSDVDWVRELADGASADIKFGLNRSRRNADFDFYGDDAMAQLAGRHHVLSTPAETGLTFGGTWRRPLARGHTLALGWDGAHQRREEGRREWQFDGAGLATDDSDDSYTATVKRLALFLQDEWQMTPRWSASLGLRWEQLATTSAGNALAAVHTRARVLSPLLQTLYKLDGNDQWRLALTRTYKAPQIQDLMPRRYTVDNNNSATNPDTQGNPALRPELAWGLDAAYEHYLAAGALLSASAFLRRIDDVTVERLYQNAGVWISTPVNDGAAQVRGIELEAKLPLSLLFGHGPAIELHGNLTRSWSRVAAVAGPDNRLARQAPLSANAGLDYRPRGAALALGANLSVQDGGRVRESSVLTSDSGIKRELDLYALWSWRGGMRLRFAVANLLRQDHSTQNTYTDASGTSTRREISASDAIWRLTLEWQF